MDDRIKEFIFENKSLFWYTDPERLENIGLSFLTETILNFGDLNAVKKLFDIVGLKEVSEVFFQSTNGKRSNYFPDVENYFRLYFKKYV